MRGTEFLPVSREEMLQRDWYYYDFLVVTADAYIERATYEIGRQHRVRVATSDGPEQIIILGHGALRLSASAFHEEMMEVQKQIGDTVWQNNRKNANSGAVRAALKKAKEGGGC